MAIEIVDEFPANPLQLRLGRRLLTLLGMVLTLAGIVVAGPVLMVPLMGALVLVSNPDKTSLPEGAILLQLAGMSVAAALLLTIGPRLARGKRHLVLLLRRFGFADATKALTLAAGTAVGRRWRLVTLDDMAIAPVGVRRRTRQLLVVASMAGMVVVVVGMVYAATWLKGPMIEETVRGTFDSAFKTAQANGENPIGAFFGAIIASMVVAFVVLLVGLLVLFVPLSLLGSATLFSWGSYRRVKQAEHSKAVEVRQLYQIETAAKRLSRQARKIFAPRLSVIRVAGPIWQDAVRRLAREATVVLIDISKPSENLLWEIDAISQDSQARRLLVGTLEQVQALAQLQPNGHSVEGRLLAMLDGDTVLVYENQSREAMNRFSLALRRRLENLSRPA